MKCFNHPDTDAVAVCKACGRAICPACVVEVGKSCACKGRCEEDVAALDETITRLRVLDRKVTASIVRAGVGGLLCGGALLLVGTSMINLPDLTGRGYLTLGIGTVLVFWAIDMFKIARTRGRK